MQRGGSQALLHCRRYKKSIGIDPNLHPCAERSLTQRHTPRCSATLQSRADPNGEDSDGNTPVILAAKALSSGQCRSICGTCQANRSERCNAGAGLTRRLTRFQVSGMALCPEQSPEVLLEPCDVKKHSFAMLL